MYNYENYIEDCLQSVLAQDLAAFSIVVVDDCSTDGSLDVARRFLEIQARRFGIARLIRHHRNQGPSMARNTAIVWSDEPLLFMLDADNLIRPPALSRLRSALSNSGADFAYPQVCFFGATNGIGRADVWTLERLRDGPYIDVMALITREALLTAGGFDLLNDDMGWEDYDLWCRFAELGFQGVFLPELLGEYRLHDAARNEAVIPIEDDMRAEIVLRHPLLFSRDLDQALRTPGAEVGDEAIQHRTIDLRQWRKEIALESSATVILERPIGIFVHLFYEELADEIAAYLANIDLPKKIYISTGSEAKKRSILRAFDRRGLGPVTELILVPDYGTDIAPLLIKCAPKFANHDICLKIHSKRSLHSAFEFGEGWRTHLYHELMGSAERVRSVVGSMLADAELGMLMAHHWHGVRHNISIGPNYDRMQRILTRIGVDLQPNQEIEYPSGSMFWFRSQALSRLAGLDFDWLDFGHAAEEKDGMLEHGMERCFLFFCADSNKKWAFLPPFLNFSRMPRDEMIRLIGDSGLFDETYYRQANPDIAEVNLLDHWIDHGAKEGRNPSASFETNFYSWMMPANYPNPLVHYILEGRTRGWPTAPLPTVLDPGLKMYKFVCSQE